MKGWLRDVEMEQCENRSHNGATSLARGGMLCVCWGGDEERWLKTEKWRHVRVDGRTENLRRMIKSLRLFYLTTIFSCSIMLLITVFNTKPTISCNLKFTSTDSLFWGPTLIYINNNTNSFLLPLKINKSNYYLCASICKPIFLNNIIIIICIVHKILHYKLLLSEVYW